MKPTPEQKRLAVHHVVYEYANLLSTGTRLLETGLDALKPPDNTHVQDAFLLSCRKMAEFFKMQRARQYVIGYDYVRRSTVTFTLSEWAKWSEAADRHVTHISYTRLENVTEWNGTANRPLLEEFRTAWCDFYNAIDERFKAEFERQIDEKVTCEGFGRLDLRS
ncbi:MAG: hypothetical protein ACRD7E_30050 [Bryobacteraceae bacterium]